MTCHVCNDTKQIVVRKLDYVVMQNCEICKDNKKEKKVTEHKKRGRKPKIENELGG